MSLSSIPVNQVAQQDVWIVGDHFLKEVFNSFEAIVQQSIRNERRAMPYLHDYYNVKPFWRNFTNSSTEAIPRFFNSLIDAINESNFLPRFITFIPDADLLHDIPFFGFGSSLVIGKVIGNLVNAVNVEIQNRREQLRKVKPGAVVSGKPKLIWLSLIGKPHYEKILSLRRKFNEILEETLTMHDNNYFVATDPGIIKENFDQSNNLSSAGKNYFWRFLDLQLKKFDSQKMILSREKLYLSPFLVIKIKLHITREDLLSQDHRHCSMMTDIRIMIYNEDH